MCRSESGMSALEKDACVLSLILKPHFRRCVFFLDYSPEVPFSLCWLQSDIFKIYFQPSASFSHFFFFLVLALYQFYDYLAWVLALLCFLHISTASICWRMFSLQTSFTKTFSHSEFDSFGLFFIWWFLFANITVILNNLQYVYVANSTYPLHFLLTSLLAFV